MNMHHEDLTALKIFHGLEEQDAASICESLQTLEFSSEDTILHEGDSVQALWIILQGQCNVSRSCSETRTRILATLKAGDVFGEMSFVRTAPHSASIVAVSDVKVCSYQRSDFLALVSRRPGAAWQISSNIAAVLAERLRRMDTWACDLFESPEGEDHRDEWKSFRSAVYTNWNF